MRTSCLYSSILALCFVPNFQCWLWYPVTHHTQPKSHPHRGNNLRQDGFGCLREWCRWGGTCRKATVPNCLHLSAPSVLPVAHWWRYRRHKAWTVFATEWSTPAQVSSDASEPAPLSWRSTHQIQSLQDQRINLIGLDRSEPWDHEGAKGKINPEAWWGDQSIFDLVCCGSFNRTLSGADKGGCMVKPGLLSTQSVCCKVAYSGYFASCTLPDR